MITSPPASGSASPSLRYRVGYRGQPVTVDSAPGLVIEGQPFSGLWRHFGVRANEGDETYSVPAAESNPIPDRYRSVCVD